MSPLQSYSMFFSILIIILLQSSPTSSQSHLCRSSCGNIPINYPLAIDDGCGSPYYRHMLICSDNNTKLQLRTPSGKYPVKSISYSDPHLLLSDPYMWSCQDRDNFRPTRSFSIDSSTHFTVSLQNDYLFFNCDPEKVIVEPKPLYCERFPDRCDSSCDSSSYLCRHLPECGGSVLGSRFLVAHITRKRLSLLGWCYRTVRRIRVYIGGVMVRGMGRTIRLRSMGLGLISSFRLLWSAFFAKKRLKVVEFVDLIRRRMSSCVFANKAMSLLIVKVIFIFS